jgi:hypothetical protein
VPILVELVKIAALAALLGMLASLVVPAFYACMIGVAAIWLLTVKAS